MPLLDRRSAASAGAMAGIYLRLLEHIAAAPEAVLSTRVSLSTAQKAMVAVRSLAATALRPPGIRRPAGHSAAGHSAAGNGAAGTRGHSNGSGGNGSGARPSDGPGQVTGADG
jgi:hypothetical protein